MFRNKSAFYILLLLLISFITHRVWFDLNSILIAGDWSFWETGHLEEFYNNFGAWRGDLNLGIPNIQIYLNIWIYGWSILTRMGLEGFQVVKLNMFIPIALLGFLSPYFLVKYFTKDVDVSFILALFYGSTTYFLISQTSHLPIAFIYSFAPLLLLFLDIALRKNSFKYWIVFSVLYALGIGYELRIMFLLTIILFLYILFFGYFSKYKKYYKNWILSAILILVLNAYWILPTVFGGLFYSIGEVAGRGLFGESLTNIFRGFTISHWSWTGGFPDKNFNAQPIKIYFWILPALTFATLAILKKFNSKQILYFLSLILIGIFFVKQSSPPFQNVYSFFRDYVPGFVLFRESSKFYIFIAIGYLGLLSTILVNLRFEHRRIFYLFSFAIVAFAFINLKPLITQEYGTLFVEKHEPVNNSNLRSLIKNDDKAFRVLWLPRRSNWFYSISLEKPLLNMDFLLNTFYTDQEKNLDSDLKEFERYVYFLKSHDANNILSKLNIRYVVVPGYDASGESSVFINGRNERDYYISELDKINYLEKIDLKNLDNIIIYENTNYKERVYLANLNHVNDELEANLNGLVTFNFKSSNEYEVFLKKVKSPVFINFSESYHPGWFLRMGDFSWLSTLFTRDKHFEYKSQKSSLSLNSFYVDPVEVCVIEKCKINDDGSFDIDMTLYFKPQVLFYLGSIISISAILFVLVYFIFQFGKYVYKKRN